MQDFYQLYFCHPTVKWNKLMEQLRKSVSRPHSPASLLHLTLTWGHLLQLMNQCWHIIDWSQCFIQTVLVCSLMPFLWYSVRDAMFCGATASLVLTTSGSSRVTLIGERHSPPPPCLLNVHSLGSHLLSHEQCQEGNPRGKEIFKKFIFTIIIIYF